MDKRKAWREQEQQLVERWNAAATRYQEVQAEILRHERANDGTPADALRLKAESARADIDALRRQVARLKAEYFNGKRY